MDENSQLKVNAGLPIKARRVIAYIVLIFLSILCLFWFYILFPFRKYMPMKVKAVLNLEAMKRGVV